MDQTAASSPFVPLPIPAGEHLRLLGPNPSQAAVAVDVLTPIDTPIASISFCLAAFCSSDGELVAPLEAVLITEPGRSIERQIPADAVVEAVGRWNDFAPALPEVPGYEWLRRMLASTTTVGPMLYCRKRHRLFVARSPRTARPLAALPRDDREKLRAEHLKQLVASNPAAARPAPALIAWDGPAQDGQTPRLYGGRGGPCALGQIEPLERLILDQGELVRRAPDITDADLAQSLAREHACVNCDERRRCYPDGDGYAYVNDRLVPVSVCETPVILLPLGEWRLAEAGAMIGSLPATDAAARSSGIDPLDAHRHSQATAIQSAGPSRLLSGETDGRELLEVARLKLGLVAAVLDQLEAAWRATGRPHLCWNEDTVRVLWRRPVSVPAAAWGFQPILRKIGLQPLAPAETIEFGPLAYPPENSARVLLAEEVVEAVRYFGAPRSGTLFIKEATPERDELVVSVLLEDFGVPWRLFTPRDALHLHGEGWQAVLAPAAERNPDDGEGLPLHGRVRGAKDAFKPGGQIDGCTCAWYPRFEQAVDLHAVGMLALELLLSHDERTGGAFHELISREREELTRHCLGVPVEQRNDRARTWLGERCEVDSPTEAWSRRNLLHRRADRNATRLDAFPPALWHAILTWCARMTTAIPGFSYCADRSLPAPHIGDALPLPAVELRGLLAMLDDQIFGRSAPAAAVREALK